MSDLPRELQGPVDDVWSGAWKAAEVREAREKHAPKSLVDYVTECVPGAVDTTLVDEPATRLKELRENALLRKLHLLRIRYEAADAFLELSCDCGRVHVNQVPYQMFRLTGHKRMIFGRDVWLLRRMLQCPGCSATDDVVLMAGERWCRS